MMEALRKRCENYTAHLSRLCGIPCCLLDTTAQSVLSAVPEERFCAGCTCPRCQDIPSHLYGSNEAFRWNGKYIYYCPLGLVFAASPVSDDTGEMVGSIVAGPVIMGDPLDTVTEIADPTMQKRAAQLPALSTTQVRDLAEVLAACTAFASGLPHSQAGGFVYEQEQVLSSIYTARTEMADEPQAFYPISYEKRLHDLVCSGDKAGAQALLNDLLGLIYCSNNFQLEPIKARVVELVVLLSRATIDAGADVREIFLFNTRYIQDIEHFTSLESLSVWLSGIMHRFISSSFDFTQVKHSDVVYKVMEYVRRNFSRKISLDDIAGEVYLSRSYLSSLFKEETGQSLFAYINHVRIEKSKQMLLDDTASLADVANLCGFEDQSYFTKVFKKAVGISPKKYRDTRGRGVPS